MTSINNKTTDDLLRDGKQPIDAESVLISEAIKTNDVHFIELLLQKKNIFSDSKVHNCWLLHEAINCKNTEIVSILLQYGACIESCPSVKGSNTALHAAVVKGYEPVIEELIRYNANWVTPNKEGQTVLHLPFSNNQIHNYCGCTSALERAELKAETGRTIIQTIEMFLILGMNINIRNRQKHTPLFLAASHRMINVCKYLLERGAQLFHDELFFHSLILDEIESFKREKVMEHCSKELVKCVVRDNVEFLNWFLSKGFNVDVTDFRGKTPLQLALEYNTVHILPTLLKYATDLTLQDMGRKTILHVFLEANSRNTPVTNEKLAHFGPINRFQNIEHVVKIMVSKGVSVDVADESGKTPLLLVFEDRRKDLLKFMVERTSSSVSAETIFAIISTWIETDDQRQEENDEIIRILVNKGLIVGQDLDLNKNSNMRLILFAIKYKLQKTFDALLARGFNATICTDQKENLLHFAIMENTSLRNGLELKDIVKFLIDWGCDVKGKTNEGRTPLHKAASCGSVEIMKILFEHEVDVNARDNLFQYTPLHMAVKNKNNSKTVIEVLIEKGADVNARQRAGKTPLHLAITHGFTDVIETLLNAGADVDAEDCKCRGPLHAALEFRDKVALKLLLEYAVDVSDFDANLITTLNYLPTRDHVWEILFKHFNQLQFIGLPYPEECQVYMKNHEEVLDSLVYSSEVKKLKNFVIEGSVTLYDFLRMNPIDRLTFTNYEKFNNLISWVENEFPFFHSVIKATYREAIARKTLIEPAKRAWLELTEIRLPNICVERIIYYSSNKVLKIMIGALETNSRKRPAESSDGKSAKKFNGATSEIWLD